MICTTCTAALERDAAFCGVCGERVRSRRDSLTGSVLDGRFHLDAKLAAGGFGAIYRATHLASGAVVALKVLHAELARDPHLAARFRREAAALAQLRDAHTLTTYELAEAPDGTLFIVMELLTGTSLLARFRAEGPLPWRHALAIARQICSSLAEAHALGIVHRDLKPANIHLEAGDHVKVLDFGIAKVLHGSGIDDGSDLTRVGQAVGTLDYMSPEQIVGGDTDGRSDLYTLGVVMYEMITGRRPFADASGPTSLLTALVTRAPVPLTALFPGLPRELDAVLLRCLERDREHRFGSAGALDAALARVLAMYPERTPPPFARPPAMYATPDGDEVTTVDIAPPHVVGFDWRPEPEHPQAEPQPTASGSWAQGSTVGPLPRERPSLARLAVWAIGLLAAGVGLGMAVASVI